LNVVCADTNCGSVLTRAEVSAAFRAEARLLASKTELVAEIWRKRNQDWAMRQIAALEVKAAAALHTTHWLFFELKQLKKEILEVAMGDAVSALGLARELLLAAEHMCTAGVGLPVARQHQVVGDALCQAAAVAPLEYYEEARHHYKICAAMLTIMFGQHHPETASVRKKIDMLKDSPGQGACACLGCNSKNDKMCAKCKKIGYCSRECQVKDWKARHKRHCQPLHAVFDGLSLD